jgi:hypothetical protein
MGSPEANTSPEKLSDEGNLFTLFFRLLSNWVLLGLCLPRNAQSFSFKTEGLSVQAASLKTIYKAW